MAVATEEAFAELDSKWRDAADRGVAAAMAAGRAGRGARAIIPRLPAGTAHAETGSVGSGSGCLSRPVAVLSLPAAVAWTSPIPSGLLERRRGDRLQARPAVIVEPLDRRPRSRVATVGDEQGEPLV